MPTEPGGASQDADSTVDNADPTRSNAPQRPGRDPKLVERDAMLAGIEEKLAAQRTAENDEFLRSADVDPRAAALLVQMEKEARGEPLDTDRGHRHLARQGGEDEQQPPEGTSFVEPIVEDAADKAARAAVRVSTKGEDPLGDYVVRVDGKPMFKTVVDGTERLIPLEDARRQLQKHLAADVRLQQAAELRRSLDAREVSIRNVEQTLKTRSQPSAPAPVDLRARAVEVVRSLVSEPEDKAAEKLANVFETIRQATAPVNSDEIANKAADVAERRIAERDNRKALDVGLKNFTKDYPDIAGDPDLFNLADRKTNAIAAEHLDWSPGEVMLEAGRQTRDWLKSIGAPVRVPAAAAASPSATRQQRKQNLVPMPQPRTARPAATEEAPEQSPHDIVAEFRKQRGQF